MSTETTLNSKVVAEAPTPKYRMTVDLNVLDHLGINLYSNVAAVVTEAVANAWDADASEVIITVSPDQNSIVIADDGIGMSVDDMNDKYLRVGYRRRDSKETAMTEKKRPVMGRKGLGKLSLFSIADCITVQSAKDGVRHGIKMTADGIRASVKAKEAFYSPTPLAESVLTVKKGTRIELTELKKSRLMATEKALRRRLARRFSVIGGAQDFRICIGEQEIRPTDRGDLEVVQFLWRFAGTPDSVVEGNKAVESIELPARQDSWDPAWKVTGWIGTAKQPKQLSSDDAGNMNGIVLHARGRLFHENALDKMSDSRLITKYITGQVEAEFLDTDEKDDIATSDRQRIQEDDPRYLALLKFLKDRLGEIDERWGALRRKHEIIEVKSKNPLLSKWLDGLSGPLRESAEKLLAKLAAIPIDKEADRATLLRHGIFAFERMRLRGYTESFVADIDHVDRLVAVLADRDALEAVLYADIVRSRVDVIRKLQKFTDENAKEKILQEHLFSNLWLLDPAWERAAGSELMETRLKEEGEFATDLTEEESLGRIDIKYRTAAGKHIIVELKRANRKVTALELSQQGAKYVDKVRKILAAQSKQSAEIEVVFVVGVVLSEPPDRIRHAMDFVSPGSRVVYYDTLINGALTSYEQFLASNNRVAQLEALVESIADGS